MDGNTHVNFHTLVEVVLHNKTVRQADTMRLHGMARNVGIVSNVGVVEVRDLLGRRPIESGGAELGHCTVAHRVGFTCVKVDCWDIRGV